MRVPLALLALARSELSPDGGRLRVLTVPE